jgi:hypothetical protein
MGDLRLLATVCTNRGAGEVRGTLEAVSAQAAGVEGAETLLVASGVTDAVHDELAALAAGLGARSVRAGPGLSVARNRALEEAGDEEVVAFIDDDVIPGPDWLARLEAAWTSAPEGVACIGGPIAPRFSAAPPAWFSDRIWESYSLLDRGQGQTELHPSRGEDAWGANVSFRAGPLRRIGGFDPMRGPWPGVPMFGDETDAERRLEAAGLRVHYAGDAGVEHLIEPGRLTLRELARRERWRGVSRVLSGARSPAGGVPRALKATAGLALAVLRRDRALAGERWARMSRESGIALAPLMRLRLRRKGWPG